MSASFLVLLDVCQDNVPPLVLYSVWLDVPVSTVAVRKVCEMFSVCSIFIAGSQHSHFKFEVFTKFTGTFGL